MPTTSAQAKASAEIIGEGLILGRTGEVLQPMVDATGALGSGFVPTPSNARMALQGLLPLKATLVQVYNTHLAQNASSKPDIRAARELVLPEAGMYTPVSLAVRDSGVDTATPVSLAVRDSGVDTARFGRQVLRGADGQPALMAFDKYGRPGTGELAVIPGDLRASAAAAHRPHQGRPRAAVQHRQPRGQPGQATAVDAAIRAVHDHDRGDQPHRQ